MSFFNVRSRTLHRWDWDAIYEDLDGSLTGTPGAVVVSKNNITSNDPSCMDTGQFKNGIKCVNTKTSIRFSFNNYEPHSAMQLNIYDSNNNCAFSPMQVPRLTHKGGFAMALEANQTYRLEFVDLDRPTNVSLNGTFFGLLPNDFLIIKFRLAQKPDKVQFIPGFDLTQSLNPLTSSSNNGDWYWDESLFELSFIVTNQQNILPFFDYSILLNIIKCRHLCTQTINQTATNLQITSRPKNSAYWSNFTTWNFLNMTFPKENDSVIIPQEKYVVVDCKLPRFRILQIEGTLEFDNSLDHKLELDILFIKGGQLIIGWEQNPILKQVDVIVHGSKQDFDLPSGLSNIGSKGIGVYGGLDLHGKPQNLSWTRLNQTSRAGSNQISLIQPVDWQVNDKIIITTTSFTGNHSDEAFISNISSDFKTITLNSSLKYDHLGYFEKLPTGTQYEIRAGVGLLSRNIRIISGDDVESDLFGFRILVSDFSIPVNGTFRFYKGYARISNVEFIHPGQFGLDNGDDSKYGILFSNIGNNNNSISSYVQSCSFYDGYSSAIGKKIA